MNAYQNWGNSRWDFTKDLSKWHFDTQRPARLGHDSYTPICRFEGDFAEAIQFCNARTVTTSWATRNNLDKHVAKDGVIYSAAPEEQDLINAGADPKQAVFDRSKADDVDVFQRISAYLGLSDVTIKYHNQKTGQMLHTHIDNFAGRTERENSFKETDFDRDPSLMRRFVVMLADWQLGQIFQIGNANWSQWRAGDCITWQWQDLPHSTANMGWWDRPMLQISGRTTDRSRAIVAEAEANLDQPLKIVSV